MNTAGPSHIRVLGVVPCSKGFGFAVLEDGERLIDWGVAKLYSKNEEEFLGRVESLLRLYDVRILASEDVQTSTRGPRNRNLLALLAMGAGLPATEHRAVSLLAEMHSLEISERKEVAAMIARWFPELLVHLPVKRKAWHGEDPRMNIFVAAFVAATCSRHL